MMEDNVQSNVNQFIVFYINDEEYAIDIQKVMTIEKPLKITRVPHTADVVKGVINLRGEIIPIIDLVKKLRMGEAIESDNTRIIIFKIDDFSVGFIVDQIVEVLSISTEQIESTAVLTDSDISAEYICGIGKIDGRIITILNLDKITMLR
jgi:purine-binding chemotaxis protein CheW